MSRIPSKCNFILTEKLQERVETLIEIICVVDSSFGGGEKKKNACATAITLVSAHILT